jgi:hypothetical protein
VRFVPACLLLTGLIGAPAYAQQPFVVDDAEVTPRRAWQLEMNVEWDRLRLSARPNLSQTVFDVEAGYGLAPRLEVAVDVPVISLSVDPRSTAETRHVTGIGDMAIAAKYRLTGDLDATHAFAASLSVELPTGSRRRGLGSSLVDVGVTLGSQHHLTSAVTLRLNAGVVAAGNTQTGALGIRRRGTILTSGTSLTATVSRRVLIGTEVVGAWSQHDALGGSFVGWQLGGNVLLRRGVTLDWGVMGGRSEASPALAFQVGSSIALGQ